MHKALRGYLMRRSSGILIVIILMASASASLFSHPRQQPPAQQSTPSPLTGGQQTSIVTQVKEVDMIAAVVNRRQKFITDLVQSDFRVLEDNKPQEIKFFSRQTDLPLRVALLLDTSNSIRPRLQFEKDAATDFLYNVLRPARDMALLMTFDSEPQVVLDYTNDLEKLRNTVNHENAGGGTALYDAMVKASQLLANAPANKSGAPEMRRVLVVISDGEDNLSSHTRADAIDAAERAGVVVYAVSTSTEWVTPEESNDPTKKFDRKWGKTEGDQILDKFALETGGRAFFPYHVDDVSQSFLDIVTELRSQYLVGYVPANGVIDGKFRKIRIDIVGHKDLEVRTRKGYYAVAPPAGGSPPAGSPNN